jgi:predicted phage terminase large subunit-like protein
MNATEIYQNHLIKTNCEIDFLFFIRYVFENYYGVKWIHNWHHDEIIKLIYAIERREIANAVINIPPRYGKTELIVILWICWTMIRNPRANFLHASYSVDLALKNSSMIRDILKSPAIQKHWAVKMRDSSDSKGLWLTEEGGGMRSDAAAGSMTGFGAGMTSWEEGDPFDGAIILDDPLKPKDSNSEAVRDSVNSRLSGTIHSRKNHSKVPIIIVMQRLHEDDPSAVALRGGVMGEEFFNLKLPALLPNGKALWPWKYNVAALQRMNAASPMDFAGQYQQEPAPLDGDVFKRDWFLRYNSLPLPPQRTRIVHSWDTAYKADQHNDPTAGTVWYSTKSQHYLAECVNKRMEYPDIRKTILAMAERDNPDAILIEDKASGQSLIQELRNNTSLPIIAIKPDGDKVTRARTITPMFEGQRVVLPQDAPWLPDYERQMLLFPNGKNDDMVDSTSQFLRWARDNDSNTAEEYGAFLQEIYS